MIKISIVTPCYNMDRFIEETIESVLSQDGNFDLEYIIVDGGSSDGTIEIIKKYESLIKNGWKIKCKSIDFKWISEKDHGMYDAINKGFEMATGEIYAWLNADDMYQNGALDSISKIFLKFPDISWLKGLVNSIEIDGEFIKTSPLRIYHQNWLVKGIYGMGAYFLEQDTVFWRSELWKKNKPIPPIYRYAGDYWLWIQFAKSSKLWTINSSVSIFRKRTDQLSQDMKKYQAEQKKINNKYAAEILTVRIFFNLWNRIWAPKKILEKFYNLILRKNKKDLYIDKENDEYTKKTARSFMAV